MKKRALLALLPLIPFLMNAALAQTPGKPKSSRYVKREIVENRYGDQAKQEWILKAYQAKKNLDAKVIGQERATYALQEALIQYGEARGTLTREPIAMHIIGLPGIGKSALLTELEKMGFAVKTFNMQQYDSRSSNGFGDNFGYQLYNHVQNMEANTPQIIVFDELDKIPEIGQDGKEITQPAIGTINEILTDGRLNIGGLQMNLSNVLFITTMNFSPSEIEHFSKTVLQQPKSYYDYTVEDFQKFDQWLSDNPGARYQVLSHLFRTNTVSRIAPNTNIFKPLSREAYAVIARMNVQDAINRLVAANNNGARREITFTQAFADFINSVTMVPSSGARETVFRSGQLTSELVGFATKYQDPALENTLDLPRKIHLDAKTLPTTPATVKVTITVTPQRLKGKSLIDLQPFTFDVPYIQDVRLFERPANVQAVAPPVKPAKVAEKPITKKQVLEARFPKNGKLARGMAKEADKTVIGQKYMTAKIEGEMNKFLGRPGPSLKEPTFMFIAGFPGIGKSMVVNTSAGLVNLPVVRIGMQQYTGQDAANLFVTDLSRLLDDAKAKAVNGKFVLLIEELDKVYEVNPQNGAIVDRPVMGMIKDLIVDGEITARVGQGDNAQMKKINIRDAFTFFTMNFGADLFGFKADPRLTSTQDMIAVWQQLSSHPADLKNVLGKLFLPETISRILPHFEIMKPLDLGDYARLIQTVVDFAARQRLLDPKSGKNVAKLELSLSPEYKRYLLDETVIPSEGARYTTESSKSRILQDIEFALNHLPVSSKVATKPLTLVLDYEPKSSSIVYRVVNQELGVNEKIAERKVVLTFPRPEVNGFLDPVRSLTSVHEFGHAYAAIRLGLRFEIATVIPPEAGTGGYVKYVDNGMSARAMIAHIYSGLGSRAMERIFFSENPLEAGSVMDISAGPSGDISGVTKELFTMIYNLGFDPNGGTFDRTSGVAAHPAAKFEDIPSEQLDAIGRVLRKMENHLIEDFLAAHPIDWYREQIGDFGRAGTLREAEFYQAIGYPYPGADTGFLSDPETLFTKLKGVVQPRSADQVKAMSYKQGKTATTASENLDRYIDVFEKELQSELHGKMPGGASSAAPGEICNAILR